VVLAILKNMKNILDIFLYMRTYGKISEFKSNFKSVSFWLLHSNVSWNLKELKWYQCKDLILILNEKGSQCECHHSNTFWKGIAVSTGIQCYTSIWTGISKSTKSLQVFCTTNIHSLVWRKPWLAQNRSTFRRHIDLWLAQNIPVNKEHMLHFLRWTRQQ
jgi:hypothetical protein